MSDQKEKTSKYQGVAEDKVTDVAERERRRIQGSTVFWAPASRHQIANYRPELFSGGRLVQAEMPLRFEDHIHVCGDNDEGGKEVKFIMASNSFKAGIVKQCADMAEAKKFTVMLKARKTVRDIHVETKTISVISEGAVSETVPIQHIAGVKG